MASTRRWRQCLRGATAVVYIAYRPARPFELRQLTLAVTSGVPIIRKWAGSDVYYGTRDHNIAEAYRSLDAVVSANITMTNGLIRELAALGLHADRHPIVLSRYPNPDPMSTDGTLPTAVLIYLPTQRATFYGAPAVRQAAQDNPDIPFIVVADKAHSLADLPNVQSLGWVDDMGPVWARCGLLLRPTEHDGFSRMIAEAQLRGRPVISTQTLPDVQTAIRREDINRLIRSFAKSPRIDPLARRRARLRFNVDNSHQLLALLSSVRLKPARRLRALKWLLQLQWQMKRPAGAPASKR